MKPFDLRVGDVRTELEKLPERSVQCVVTSPPYWALRDYGVEGQLGSVSAASGGCIMTPEAALWLAYGVFMGGVTMVGAVRAVRRLAAIAREMGK